MTALKAHLDLTELNTWPKVLKYNASHYGSAHAAMRFKHYGIWQTYSWQDYLQRVKEIALGLRSLGFGPGSRLLVIGDNCPEWYFAEMAAQCNRGVCVGLYADFSAAEIEYVARDSAAEFALVEDQEQVDKILQVRDRLPALKHVLFWRYKGLDRPEYEGLVGIRELTAQGRAYEAAHPGEFESTVAAGEPDDLCAIVYTSGATGEWPKGALHSHRSLMASARPYFELDDLHASDSMATALPPAWITEQILGYCCHLLSGATMNFPENSETLREDIREVAPTVVVYSARLWEGQIGQIEAGLRGATRLKRWFSDRLLPVGDQLAAARYSGRSLGWKLAILRIAAELFVFRKIRDGLGLPRVRLAYTFGSVLSPDALRFFHGLGVRVKNVYCSAEAGAVTGAGDRVQTPGTVGRLNPGVEVSVSDRGELLVRSEGRFRGYCSGEVVSERADLGAGLDGWLHTGDTGHINGDRELVFVDRLEDLMLLPCGDLLAPQAIESRLRHSPYIRDAWVLAGADCPFVSAVIVVDAENAGRWADRHKVTYTTFSDLSQKPEIYDLIEKEIARVNNHLPASHQIQKFVNLHKELDPDESELTRDRKLRRSVLKKRYADLVRALSEECYLVDVEAEITYQDGRTGKLRTALKIAVVGSGGV
ncbi:MAG: AMP-binding protein [Thermoleophilia bacterium]|nr:AMP-binding protein [Thermoleophilia bacterium]